MIISTSNSHIVINIHNTIIINVNSEGEGETNLSRSSDMCILKSFLNHPFFMIDFFNEEEQNEEEQDQEESTGKENTLDLDDLKNCSPEMLERHQKILDIFTEDQLNAFSPSPIYQEYNLKLAKKIITHRFEVEEQLIFYLVQWEEINGIQPEDSWESENGIPNYKLIKMYWEEQKNVSGFIDFDFPDVNISRHFITKDKEIIYLIEDPELTNAHLIYAKDLKNSKIPNAKELISNYYFSNLS